MAHLLIYALLLLSTTASPTPAPNEVISILKRANPVFGDTSGFINSNIQQVTDGFSDACTLAKAARDTAKAGNAIFNKYFPDAVAPQVLEVFQKIIGNDTSIGGHGGLTTSGSDPPKQAVIPCATRLSDLKIRSDFENSEGKLSCSDPIYMAATRDGEEDEPTVIICPSGLKHGGIGRDYTVGVPPDKNPPGPPAVNCQTLDDRTSWRMDTMGSVLLHEYTHFGNLVAPPLGQGTTDDDPDSENPQKPDTIYGPIQTQAFGKDVRAITIADSYAWFANEAFWSLECKKSFGAPKEGDDEDPSCGAKACQDSPV